MQTIFPEQPLSHNHRITADMSTPPSQPVPEIDDGSKPHLSYKCLLNQHTQKLRNPPPVYQTQNEGSDHLPRFRSTVWLDGVSYTSSSTFQQRKMAEMDVSKVAYMDITQKAKTEALDFIREDKLFCKSIMAEFAAKKNIGKPIYTTTQLEGSVPVFCSNLLFNGVTYPGDNGKSKKQAEQLVARSVIIKFLDSEDGNDMAAVVNCKLRQYHEMNKVLEIKTVQNGSNVLGAETGIGHDFTLTGSGTCTMVSSSVALESSLGQGTMLPTTSLSAGSPQPIIPQLSVEPVTLAAPIIIQPPTPPVSTISIVPEPSTSQVPVEPIKPSAEPLVLNPVQCTPVVSVPLVKIPTIDASNGIQQPMPEASCGQALVGETSNKRQHQKNKKNARKKRRADAQ
ncbi:hypothetical protein R6Q57_000936 [Mikania cordata]